MTHYMKCSYFFKINYVNVILPLVECIQINYLNLFAEVVALCCKYK